MKKTKIVLFGTPKFAIKIFQEVIENFEVLAIVCQPDNKAFRGQKVIYSDVKKLAIANKIQLFQPEKTSDIFDQLAKLDIDIILSCAYGKLISSKILNLAKIAAINIHGSLLPKYRGASPIQQSLINNDEYAGITLIYMVKEMDAGDMIFKASVPITPIDDFLSLSNKLSELAASNIVEWIDRIVKNEISPLPQKESEVTFANKLEKDFFEIKSNNTVNTAMMKIKRFANAYSVFILHNNERYKIFDASTIKVTDAIEYKLKDGSIFITELQSSNKKRMSTREFLLGNSFD